MSRLRDRIEQALSGEMTTLDVVVPYSRNDLVSLWRQYGEVDTEAFVEQGVHLCGKLPVRLLGHFAQFRTEPVER
jgi:GTP-binding protein HflX